jgi:hypothetical protein
MEVVEVAEQYSTPTIDPNGRNICAILLAGKIVMSQLEKAVERTRTFERMQKASGTK